MTTQLLECSDADFEYLDERITCADIDERDFPDWEDVLRDPQRSPVPHMRKQRQRMNDCRGQSMANGVEARRHYTTGEMVQMSDIYGYNGTEFLTSPSAVGRNRGANILIGVRLLTEGIPEHGIQPGLPKEADWPYDTYARNHKDFIRRAKEVQIVDGSVSEQLPMPSFQKMLIAVAARGTGDIGTRWPPNWGQLRGQHGVKRWMKSAPRGGGGHATQIIWAEFIDGEWQLITWNSHDDAFFYISENAYTEQQRNQFRPYGARLLMPVDAAEKYVNWHENSPYYD